MLSEEYLVEVARSPGFQRRFWAKVRKTDGCWIWTGSNNGLGYGDIMGAGYHQLAHRMAWRAAHGPIPQGAEIMHDCDTPACVNPGHLRPGSHARNLGDAAQRGRFPRGEKCWKSKLTAEVVREIRASQGRLSHREAAMVHGVDRRTVADARSRRTWRHVP